MVNLVSCGGILIFLFMLWCASGNRSKVDWKMVVRALAVQVLWAFVIVRSDTGIRVIEKISDGVMLVLSYGSNGLNFVFGSLNNGGGPAGFIFIIQVLGNIIFLGALVGVLYYLGILGFVIDKLGWVVEKITGASRVESFVCTANIFLGQTESPLMVSRYISTMTRSEIMSMLVSGLSSMSVSILGGYAALGIPMKNLIVASAMVPFSSLFISKILEPETEQPLSPADLKLDRKAGAANLIEAITNGAQQGMQLVLAISASLVAFLAFVAMVNGALSHANITLEKIFGYIFYPFAYLTGLRGELAQTGGQLIGTTFVLNEFISFETLGKMIPTLEPRVGMIMTMSQAGFANIGSMGVCVAGLGALCPEKKSLMAQLIVKALYGAVLANLINASLLGIAMSF